MRKVKFSFNLFLHAFKLILFYFAKVFLKPTRV